mmetsp:Transcript_14901/g.2493  ORF Transcript_14901/g.2493 Transcript_14901/m.2493 type:complete len:115 (+) Transcript_14901:257-601(+)
MERSGLSILKALKALRFTPLEKETSIHAVTTIVKSKIFQTFLKYALLLNIKPRPPIFKTASIVYIHRKMVSKKAIVGSYSSVVGSSIANVIVLAIITSRIKASNSRCIIINLQV